MDHNPSSKSSSGTHVYGQETAGTPYYLSKITPHNKALYEAGKKMLVDSIDAGRDFCKFMISLAITGIPVYIALLKLAGAEDLRMKRGHLLIVPPVLLLISVLVYILGYFPRSGAMSLDIVEDIDVSRSRLLRHRLVFIVIGTTLFLTGVLIAIFLLVVQKNIR